MQRSTYPTLTRLLLTLMFLGASTLTLACGDTDPCVDGLMSEGESDIDCGGICAQLCALDASCSQASDCASGCCNASGVCEADEDEDGVCDSDVCVPECTERACGDDGCGGVCGECGEYEECTEEWSCEIPSLTGWPGEVTIFPFLDDQVFEGDIAAGAPADVGWGDEPGVNCWSFVQGKYFTGHQVFYAMDRLLQKSSQLEVTMTPEAGVDLNLYAFALEEGDFYMPPAVPAVSDCLHAKAGGEGEAESLYLQNLQTPLQWLIAVVGPEGLSEGAFSLQIDRLDVLR